ncbi:hypothetical protein [Brevibacillus sp. H7]|uniref:hypothetical protein n=1 Tax=Brevibacillus sp. H7 TaxID=3349138 RepID=UPI00382730F9
MSKRLIVVFFLLLLLQPYPFVWSAEQVSALSKQPIKTVVTDRFETGVVLTKKVLLPNGDLYWMKRLEFTSDHREPYTFSIPLSGSNGTFRYVERLPAGNRWATIPVDTKLPQPSGFLQTNQMSMLLNASNFYIKNVQGTFEQQPNPLPINVIRTLDGYKIHVHFPQKKNSIAEIWGLESKESLVDWSSTPDLEAIWLAIDLQEHSKWSWDGYYVRSPQTYTPYSPNMFWRLPANYAAHSFIITGGSRAADDLGWVMLDTILPNQNREGYWETLPRSEWLWKDYGIGAGFFDTRFNTDIATLLLKGYRRYGDRHFYQAAEKYSYYLLAHIDHHHYTNYGESEGWLPADYSWKQPHKKTHVSLNHHLHEMNFLYEMYLETKQEFYKEMADKLLYGVKNTKSMWIKPNHDLHYAYLPNGKMGLQDYPFLTYNDLVESQSLFVKIYGRMDPDLAELMANKKQWMDQTGVKGYRFFPL